MTCSCDVISARTCSCDVISVTTCSCDVISIRTCSCDVISIRTCSCDVISVRTCSFDVMYSVLSTALSKTNVNQNASFIYAIGNFVFQCGFFERRKKADVDKWKRQSGYYATRKSQIYEHNPRQSTICNYSVQW